MNINEGQFVVIINEEPKEHPFKVGQEVEVISFLGEGKECFWAKDKNGEMGCLITGDYEIKIERGN